MTTRFARVVATFAEKERYCIGSDILYREDVAKLLQREYAAVRRKVRAMKKGYAIPHLSPKILDKGNEWVREAVGAAYEQACADLLAWLDERGR